LNYVLMKFRSVEKQNFYIYTYNCQCFLLYCVHRGFHLNQFYSTQEISTDVCLSFQ
jgi:hypothetical protein